MYLWKGKLMGKPGTPKGSRKKARVNKLPELRDMLHVYEKEKSEDETPGQKMFRKMFEDDPRAFVDRMMRANAAHQVLQREAKDAATKLKAAEAAKRAAELAALEPVAVEEDERTVRVLGLIRELELEWGVKR